MKVQTEIKVFPRIPTGVRGLDTLLGGGFLKGGIYLLMGPPGSGKTILANQFGFNHCAKGHRALYISLLSESHSRLFGHLKPMHFFKEDYISESFNYVSAYHILEKDGLEGLLRSIALTVRQYKATLLFIDGVASAEELANSPVSFKKFVHDLNTVLGVSGCTALLLSSLNHDSHPEHTMVDGIISLASVNTSMRDTREIQVSKMRGTRQLTGRHVFTISDEGVSVYPRVESYFGRSAAQPNESAKFLSCGGEGLDEMLGGGIMAGSMTAVIGGSGTGKTSLGTQFLAAGAAKGEPALYFGFYEAPSRLLRKMEKINSLVEKAAKTGKLEVFWQPSFETNIDEMAHKLLELVERYAVKRLFIDGIVGLREGLVEEARLKPAFTAIANELRARGVTTFFTEETKLFPLELDSPVSDHSAITDNIIYLRHTEIGTEFKRIISVLKSRESQSETKLREFEVGGKNGFHITSLNVDLDSATLRSPEKKTKKKSSARSSLGRKR